MTETTYREAIRQALLDGMEADPSVILMGEEVGLYGGAYGVTKGLIDLFGAATGSGAATGAASATTSAAPSRSTSAKGWSSATISPLATSCVASVRL